MVNTALTVNFECILVHSGGFVLLLRSIACAYDHWLYLDRFLFLSSSSFFCLFLVILLFNVYASFSFTIKKFGKYRS